MFTRHPLAASNLACGGGQRCGPYVLVTPSAVSRGMSMWPLRRAVSLDQVKNI